MTNAKDPPPNARRAGSRRFGRLRTIGALAAHFMHRERFFLAPLLVVLLAAAALLILTGGLSYVAPFIYAIF